VKGADGVHRTAATWLEQSSRLVVGTRVRPRPGRADGGKNVSFAPECPATGLLRKLDLESKARLFGFGSGFAVEFDADEEDAVSKLDLAGRGT